MIKNTLMRLYIWCAALLVRALVKYCTARGRYVDYVHATGEHLVTCEISPECLRAVANSTPIERVYMRRYVITGFMTGDPHPNSLAVTVGAPGLWFELRALWGQARRWWALNRWHLYLHHMHAPDADECLHDHPWPWGLSFILLGGYREERLEETPAGLIPWYIEPRWRRAPALNVLHGTTFHRISGLEKWSIRHPKQTANARDVCGVFTLFLAGPRRASKPWGYLVPGRGFVPQRERHAETGAREERAKL